MEDSVIQFDEVRCTGNSQIPFDLFVSKQHKGLGTRGFLRFTDSAGNLVYTVKKLLPKSAARDPHYVKLLSDPSAKTLTSIKRLSKRSWQGFRGNEEEKVLIFTVDKTVDDSSRTEFRILLFGENNQGTKTELLMKGSPFRRSCTIYKADSIVAQSSLMHKLGMGTVLVPRNRFRVTLFPGFSDHSLVASLIAVYFDGRKLWI